MEPSKLVLDPVLFPDAISVPEGSKKPLLVVYWCVQGEGAGGSSEGEGRSSAAPCQGPHSAEDIFSLCGEWDGLVLAK